jgi:hypothetical protein
MTGLADVAYPSEVFWPTDRKASACPSGALLTEDESSGLHGSVTRSVDAGLDKPRSDGGHLSPLEDPEPAGRLSPASTPCQRWCLCRSWRYG